MTKKTAKKFDVSRLADMFVDDAEDIWRQYRRLVRKKEIAPLRDEALVRAMFSAMIRDAMDWRQFISIADQLRKNPDLLETDIWVLFEFEHFPHGWNLTSWDIHFSSWEKERRKGEDWKGTFCTLIEEGTIPKKRVLDGIFRSLSQPFTDYESKWYVGLLEQMITREIVPSKEQAEDARFLALLDHPNTSPRSLGLKILEQLFKLKLIAEKDVLRYIPSIFLEPAKGKAKKAVTLLEKIAKTNEVIRPEVCRIALEGLRHETVDVQQSALDLLLKYDGFADPHIAKSVTQISPSLAASVRGKIPGEKETTKKAIPPSRRTVVEEALEIRYEPIEPVQSFDELFDLAVRLVEKIDDFDEVERFLDGLSRLGNEKPNDFETKTKPLLKRIKAKTAIDESHSANKEIVEYFADLLPLHGIQLVADVRCLIGSWILNEFPEIITLEVPYDRQWKHLPDDERYFRHQFKHGNNKWYLHEIDSSSNPVLLLFSKRIEAVLSAVIAGRSCPMLSAPTHKNAWIDPSVFVRRFIETKKSALESDDYDRVLALLRLKPEGRKDALKTLDASIKKRDDYCNAVRYALGADKVNIGQYAPYWIAAARCRNPFEDDPRVEKAFPNLGPGAGTFARYSLVVENLRYYSDHAIVVKTAPAIKQSLTSVELADLCLFPSVAIHYGTTRRYEGQPGYFPWLNSIWPQNLDPATATTIDSCACDVDTASDYGFSHLIPLLGNAAFALHSIGASALFIALSCKSQLTHTSAIDSLITVIADGRLKSGAAISSVRELLGLKALKTIRWSPHLKTISEQSGRHASFVFELLEGVLDQFPARELGVFLEIMNEIGVTLRKQVSSEPCREFLQSLSGSGKAAKLAKKLLEK